MRRMSLVVSLGLILAMCLAPSSAAATSPAKASGSVGIHLDGFHPSPVATGDGMLEFVAFAESGVPGSTGYKEAWGQARFSSDVPGYAFDLRIDNVEVWDGLFIVRGDAAGGRRFGMIIIDGGTPGAGNDAVIVIRYQPGSPSEITFWSTTSGNLQVKLG